MVIGNPSKRVLLNLVVDHVETFSISPVRRRARLERARGYAVQLLVPVVPAAVVLWRDVHVHGAGQLMAGLAVLTGLLFGLLFLVWTTGIQLRENKRWSAGDHVVTIVDDLRANVTYASMLSLLLVSALVVASATTAEPPQGKPDPGLNIWWSAGLVWLSVHLVMVLLNVLQRLRSAYSELTA